MPLIDFKFRALLTFPSSKINIGLYITARREDGFHDLESIFYPIPYCDALEVITSDVFSFESKGLVIDGNEDANLCVKAYKLLKKHYDLPPVKMFLYKNIPMGAGLGGGSSDAAFCLKMLNEIFALNINEKQMLEFAAELGSDCPFFINNAPSHVTGRGENIAPVSINLSGLHITIIHTGIHISTREAFRNITPQKPPVSLIEAIKLPIEKWQGLIRNDFEPYSFKACPELENIKQDLISAGAIYTSMTGSGSAIYALSTEKLNYKPGAGHYTVWHGQL